MVDSLLACRPMVNNTERNTMVEDRIAALEARANTFEARLRQLEGAPPARAAQAEGRRAVRAPIAAPTPAPRPAPPRQLDLEDFLGGSVLAWLGGTAVVAGLAFLLTVAVSRGWLGEGARTALAGALSLGLLGCGVRLRERRGRNDAALSGRRGPRRPVRHPRRGRPGLCAHPGGRGAGRCARHGRCGHRAGRALAGAGDRLAGTGR